MSQRITDAIVKRLPTPAKGNRIHYDSDVKGFGCRVTAKGTRAFILNYRTRAGRERRFTIGAFPDWQTSAARDYAKELKKDIDRGEDPLADVESDRTAKTVADLCERFLDDHVGKLRPSTAQEYRAQIEREILPALRHRKVDEVAFTDVDALHRKITKRGAPYYANRVVSTLSKMFNLANRWKWCSENPCKGIERNPEEKRHRYLSGDELSRLTMALAEHPDQQAANIVRLLLLTGARRGELMSATWDQFDLDAGVWTKPGATTKQKTMHRVPLSAPARQLLVEMRETAESEFVFPSRSGGHRTVINKAWHELCHGAGIVTRETVKDVRGKTKVITKPSARPHDLRHTYASVLASSGLSLPIIGALLGHTQAQTTARYAHLFDDPLRAATERVGAVVMPLQGGSDGEVVPMKGGA